MQLHFHKMFMKYVFKLWKYENLRNVSWRGTCMKDKNMELLFQKCFHPIGIPVWCAVLSTMGVTSLWQWAIKNSLAKRIGFNPKGEHMGAYAPMALKYASTYYVVDKYFYPIVCNTSAVCCAVVHHGCHILMPMSNKKFPLSKGWVRPPLLP